MKNSAFVLNGPEAFALLRQCQLDGRALPAVNVTSSSTINAVLESAASLKSPVIIQLSHGGSVFYAGKGVDNTDQRAAIAGAISAALHIHTMAALYQVPVILHTDHAARKLLPWIDGLMREGAKFREKTGRPLFTSHMLDLSEEPLADNLATSCAYFKAMRALDMMIEVELGVTGGEEDGVDNSGVDESHLYSQPHEILQTYQALRPVGEEFLIAAAFGNVHGVYKPGNVKLRPEILRDGQTAVATALGLGANTRPIAYVFHGGSGSEPADIHAAIDYGVVKMNVDTDLQWAYWNGVRAFEAKNRDYLQGQLGNPSGPDAPNKKFYDPRVWIREGETSLRDHLSSVFKTLQK